MAASVTLTLDGPVWAGLASEKAAVVPAAIGNSSQRVLYYETDTGAAGLTNPWFIWTGAAWVAFMGFPASPGSGGTVPVTGVPGTITRVRATLNSVSPGVIAAAGDYAAGDVLNDSTTAGHAWVFPSLTRLAASGILIQKVLITCSVAALVPRFRLHLWNTVPSVLQNDNVAFLLDLDDRAIYLGYIDMPAMQTSGSSEISWSEVDLQWIGTSLAATSLYGVLQTLDGFTNESAGMTMDIFLTGVQS